MRCFILIAGCFAAVLTISLTALLVWYGLTAFKDCPIFDDWKTIDRLHAFLDHRVGLGYFFERQNLHPGLAGRILLFADYLTFSLDLRVVRWLSVAIMVATAALVGARLFRDLRGGESCDMRGRAIAAVLAAPPCALVLSLGHWEVLSIAIGVDSLAVNLFAVAAIFLIDRWRRRGGALSLVAALVMAACANMNMLQGMFVWPAMGLGSVDTNAATGRWRPG